MKTSKHPAAAGDAAPNRRQPVRQTRTNPPRSSVTASRAARDREAAAAAQEQPIDIFPGVTHFADAITALPKELVKHFTLLKEVDAKINVPQQALFELINTALRLPVPNTTRSPYDGSTTASAPASAPMTAQNSSAGSATGALVAANGHPTSQPSNLPLSGELPIATGSAYDESNIPRRQLFHRVAVEIRDMLVALEEKNHVISTANEALNKQLGRIDDIWPHLEKEFSEEAKWGSNMHWAYPENRAASRATNSAQAERSRREGAASLSAAAQQIAEEAAARSDARKQAVAARRSQKTQAANNHHDSDADDLHQKAETKKSGGSKSRKTAAEKEAAAAAAAAAVGLGISAGASGAANGAATSAPKRRRVEKPAAPGSVPMERALSGVYASDGGKNKTSSPRESPAPDAAAKKRKALPAGGNTAKKSRSGTSAASSPVIGAFPDNSKLGRASPAPPMPPSSLLATPVLAESHTTSPSLDSLVNRNGSAASIATTPAEKLTGKPNEAFADSMASVAPKTTGDSKKGTPVPGGATASTSNTAANKGNSPHVTEAAKSNSGVSAKNPGNAASSTSSSSANGVTTTPIAPPSVGPPSKDARSAAAATSEATTPAPAVNGVALSYAAASPEDQSAAQLKADDDKQRTPQQPAPVQEKRPNGVAASAEPAPTSSAAASHTNGLQAPADKPSKEAPSPATSTTPVPIPVPAAAAAAAATAAASVPPVISSRNTPKLEALKTEAAENSPPMTAMTMTRTRSAGGHMHDAKREAASGSSSSDANGKADEVTAKKEATSSSSVMAIQPPPVMTKSGRASKPSTPALATFAEASSASSSSSRSRPSRASEPASNGHGSGGGSGNGNGSGSGSGSGSGTAKRSHKKGASSVSSQAIRDRDNAHSHGHHHSASDVVNSISVTGHGSGGSSHGNSGGGSSSSSSSNGRSHQNQQQHKQSAEEDDDEPLYCYCQRISFGEMIACDSDDCKREWFHLECVGLRVAPKTNVKWYCDDCKKRIKNGDRKSGGR